MNHTTADFAEHAGDEIWVHYSNVPQVTINPKGFHQDPAGIYLFPKDFPANPNWLLMKYRFEVKLDNSTKVLDLSTLSVKEAKNILDQMGLGEMADANEYFNDATREHNERIDTFWEIMKNEFILRDGKRPGAWNKALQSLGYSAVFDDVQVIHTAEEQLLVLDKSKIQILKREDLADTGYDDTLKILEHVKELVGSYGKVELKKPTKTLSWGIKSLRGEIKIYDGSKTNTGHYANWVVSPQAQQKSDSRPSAISVSLQGSSHRFDYSVGTTVDRFARNRKPALDFKDLDQDVKRAMDKIWAESPRAESSVMDVAGIEDTDFPYFHVSKHPETPSIHLSTTRGGAQGKYFDPYGIYLFKKGEHVDISEWSEKPYRWDAKIKPGAKIRTVSGFSKSEVLALLKKAGMKTGLDFYKALKNAKNRSTEDEIEFDYLKDLLEEIESDKDDPKSSIRDNPNEEDMQAFLSGSIPDTTWFRAIRCHFMDRQKFTDFWISLNIDGLDDDAQAFYAGEPQLCILNPDVIEWGPREENKVDKEIYQMRQESSVAAASGSFLDWDDLYTIESYVDEKDEPTALEDVPFTEHHREIPAGAKAYRAISMPKKSPPDLEALLDPNAWTFTESVSLEFAELQGQENHRYAAILSTKPKPEQVVVYLPNVVADFEHAAEDNEELFQDVLHTIKTENEVVLKNILPQEVTIEGYYDRKAGKLVMAASKDDLEEKYAKNDNAYMSWPVKIDGDDSLHVTCKFIGTDPFSVAEVVGLIQEAGGNTHFPVDFDWEPITFDTDNDGKVKVLELKGVADNVKACHDCLWAIRTDDYPDYKPHITVPDELWERIKAEGLTPLDLDIKIGALKLEKAGEVLYEWTDSPISRKDKEIEGLEIVDSSSHTYGKKEGVWQNPSKNFLKTASLPLKRTSTSSFSRASEKTQALNRGSSGTKASSLTTLSSLNSKLVYEIQVAQQLKLPQDLTQSQILKLLQSGQFTYRTLVEEPHQDGVYETVGVRFQGYPYEFILKTATFYTAMDYLLCQIVEIIRDSGTESITSALDPKFKKTPTLWDGKTEQAALFSFNDKTYVVDGQETQWIKDFLDIPVSNLYYLFYAKPDQDNQGEEPVDPPLPTTIPDEFFKSYQTATFCRGIKFQTFKGTEDVQTFMLKVLLSMHSKPSSLQIDTVNPKRSKKISLQEFIKKGAQSLSSAEATSTKSIGPVWYHLTDNEKFRLDPDYAPEDNTFALDDRSGRRGIYLAEEIEPWVNGKGYWRPFVVEFHVDPSVVNDPGISGRWGGELFVPSTSFEKLKIVRIIPLDAYAREHFWEYGWIEGDIGHEFDTGEKIPLKYSEQKKLPGYKYTGPDVRDMPAADISRLKKDLKTFLKSRHAAGASVQTADTFQDEGIVDGNWGSQASGILFRSDDSVLLLMRSSSVMDPNVWGIPGGAVPVDENDKPMDPKASALNEAEEEMSGMPPHRDTGKHVVFKKGEFRYTTYLFEVEEEFSPALNWEHSDAQWFPIDDLPTDIHPGALWAIEKLFFGETSAAKIAAIGSAPIEAKVFLEFENGQNGIVQVYRNPTRAEFTKVAAKWSNVRAFLDGDSLFVWDPIQAIHAQVFEKLGAGEEISDQPIPLILYTRMGKIDDAQVTDFSKRTKWHHKPEVVEAIQDSEALQKLASPEGFSVSFYDEAIGGPWDGEGMQASAAAKKVEAGLSPILYHVTDHAQKILEQNRFILRPAGSSSDKTGKPSEHFYFLSTMRVPSGGYRGKSDAILVLDGIKLGQKYKGSPYHYWGADWVDRARKDTGVDDANIYDETEDRIWSRQSTIPNATDYIKEIHLNLRQNDRYREDQLFATLRNREVRKAALAAKKAGIPVFVYTDKEAFKLLNKSKAIPLTDLDLSDKPIRPEDECMLPRKSAPYSLTSANKRIKAYIELYHAKEYATLSKDAKQEARYLWDRMLPQILDEELKQAGPEQKQKLTDIWRKLGINTSKEYVAWLTEKMHKLDQEEMAKRKTASSVIEAASDKIPAILYHGSPRQGLTDLHYTPENARMDSNSLVEGEGIYLTESYRVARGYAGSEGSVYEVKLKADSIFLADKRQSYLNIYERVKKKFGIDLEEVGHTDWYIERCQEGRGSVTGFGDSMREVLINDESFASDSANENKAEEIQDFINQDIAEWPVVRYLDANIDDGRTHVYVVRQDEPGQYMKILREIVVGSDEDEEEIENLPAEAAVQDEDLYPTLGWVKSFLQENGFGSYQILEAYITGSVAKKQQTPDSDLDISMVIEDNGEDLLELNTSLLNELPPIKWRNVKCDFNFVFNTDPAFKGYKKIKLTAATTPRKLSGSEQEIVAYHGSNSPIKKFDRNFSAQGVFWFSENRDKILNGESGASSTKYMIEVILTVQKTAGWPEYEKLGLGQLQDRGYDSINLDDDWVIFDPKNIKITGVVDLTKKAGATVASTESFLPEDLVMLDCEMTGVMPDRDKLLQIAMTKLKLQGNQYVEYGEPLVLYMQHEGQPENDFHREHLAHIFERCNESKLQPGEAKEAICTWLGELMGKVTPVGDCVPTDMDFLRHAGCIDSGDIGDEGPIPGTFHYEYFDMNGIKALARHKMGKKEDVKELAGYDEENVHDALVDCRNQTKELNHYMKALLEADKIAAAIKAAARPAFKSHDLDLFWSILEIEERTEKYYLSSDADDEWKFQQEDNGKEDREEWAKEESEFWRDQGYPSHYFYSQKAVPKGSWLIHFTDANPMAIVQGGFLGRTVDIVGLTTGYKPGSHPGSLALAYPVDNVTHDRSGFGKYGKNAVLFQVREGIAAYHFGDEEVQVIFDVKGAYNLHPIRDEDGGLTLYDKTGQKQLLLCDRNQDCVDQMVGLVSKKKRAEKSRSRSAIEAAAKRKRPRMELPDHVLPTPMDDYALDDSKRAAVLRFDGKAQGCVTFEDFQDLLSAALLELQLTEEYRRSIAGILNMTRQEKGLELL